MQEKVNPKDSHRELKKLTNDAYFAKTFIFACIHTTRFNQLDKPLKHEHFDDCVHLLYRWTYDCKQDRDIFEYLNGQYQCVSKLRPQSFELRGNSNIFSKHFLNNVLYVNVGLNLLDPCQRNDRRLYNHIRWPLRPRTDSSVLETRGRSGLNRTTLQIDKARILAQPDDGVLGECSKFLDLERLGYILGIPLLLFLMLLLILGMWLMSSLDSQLFVYIFWNKQLVFVYF